MAKQQATREVRRLSRRKISSVKGLTVHREQPLVKSRGSDPPLTDISSRGAPNVPSAFQSFYQVPGGTAWYSFRWKCLLPVVKPEDRGSARSSSHFPFCIVRFLCRLNRPLECSRGWIFLHILFDCFISLPVVIAAPHFASRNRQDWAEKTGR